MAYYPISRTAVQYTDSNGDPYSGAVLKAYQDGSSTVLAMATDDTGGTTATSMALNSDGYVEVSGNIIIPHLNQDYKLALYPTQTAADANSGAVWTIDNIPIIEGNSLSTATLATLKAIDSTVVDDNQTITMANRATQGDGGGGPFYWDASDLSTQVTADTLNGRYVPPNSDTTGASGAWVRRYSGALNVRWYGAVGDGSTDDTAALQAAIVAAETDNGGVIFLPAGTYKITTKLDISEQRVSMYGEGGDVSIISALSCTALSFISASYDNGNSFFRDFGVTGASGSTADQIAIETILPPGGTSSVDSRDGLHFERISIYDWDVGFNISDTWESSITKCKFEKCNQNIVFNTYSMLWRVYDNFMVFNAGDSHSGTSASVGINILGAVTEGLYLVGNQIYAYDTCIDLVTALHTNIISNDLFGYVYGIKVATANTGCNIVYNYVLMGANNAIGIYGVALGSTISNNILVEGNVIQSSTGSFTGTIGIQINSSGTQNNNNWNILNNHFLLFKSYDILIYNGANIRIDGNKSESTGLTDSINATALSGEVIWIGEHETASQTITGGTRTNTTQGTFTPVVADASTAGNTASGTFTGHYAKSGPIVNISITLTDIDTTGLTGANFLWIRDLPYTVTTGASARGVIDAANVTLSNTPIFALDSGTAGRVYQNATGTTTDILLVSDLTSTTADLTFSLTYLTDG